MRTLIGLTGAVLLLVSSAVHAATLAKDGVSDYVIVLADQATGPERTAAAELQQHLKAVTGATLPVLEEKATGSGAKRIVVGVPGALTTVLPNLDIAALGRDGIVMKTVGDTLYLAGGRPRGALNAVYTFLEDVVGCRWWSSAESFTPARPTLHIPTLDVVYTPALLYREAFYRDAVEGIYAARCKCNGHFDRVPAEYGGHYSILGWCHTFYQLLPPDKYFAAHPEWYSGIGGKRVGKDAQLCLTNEAMRGELVKNALEWIRKDPSAGIISIAQNDCGGRCECAACAAAEKEEGAPSGLLLRFVNAVAEEIGKEFPDVLVETLAYQYTRQAPQVTHPRDNVIVRLCSIECSFSEPLATAPRNADFRRDIEAWSAIAKKLYVWDYVTNFREYLLPHPNWKALAPNIRFFVANHCVGLFEQGDIGSSCGEFVELRAWLLAHLMWDPSRDADALIDEFLAGYYGPAAWPLRRYLDLTSDAIARADVPLRCYMESTAAWMTPNQLAEAQGFFDQAIEAVKDDPTLTARVKRAQLPLTYAWLNRYAPLRRLAKIQNAPFLGPADPIAASQDFARICNEFKVGAFAEGRPFKDLEAMLAERFRAPAPAPEVCKGLAGDRWLDVQDNEFVLANSGVWVQLVDDAAASDGKAASMPGSHTQWAIQFPITADLAALGRVHCYVLARCRAAVASGNAFQLGLYDSKGGRPVVQRMATIEETRDGYRAIDLGVQALAPGMYLWVAPLGNSDEVSEVAVDRIVLIAE